MRQVLPGADPPTQGPFHLTLASHYCPSHPEPMTPDAQSSYRLLSPLQPTLGQKELLSLFKTNVALTLCPNSEEKPLFALRFCLFSCLGSAGNDAVVGLLIAAAR